jgi:zinc protease
MDVKFERLALGFVAALTLLVSSSAGAAEPALSPRPFQFVLQNGLQVVVVPDRRAPVVSQMLWFKTGAADDPPGLSGMAHFFEHMMFRGTKSVPGEGFLHAIARNGGEANAFTTHDTTVFFERIAKDRLRLAMHLEADRMQHLELTDAGVATERDVVLAERRQRIDNDPEAEISEQAAAALHLSHPYGRPVIGWADEVRRIGRAEAEDYYRRHFAPNNAILVVVGDVSPDEVRAQAEAEYGQFPARELLARAEYAQPPRLGETRLAIVHRNVKVPYFLRLYRVPSYAQASLGRAEALEVLAHLLGGDHNAVLYRRLVLERRIATDVAVGYDGYARDAGVFSISARPRPGVGLETLERAIDEIVGYYLGHQPARADLVRAKKQLVAETVFRQDNPFETASVFGRTLAVGLTVQDVTQWPQRIQAMSGEAVRKAASALVKREAVTATLSPGR